MKCPGIHCPGCGNGGGRILALIVFLFICAAIARPAEHAATDVFRVVAEVLMITAYVLISVAGVAVLTGVTMIGLRVRRWSLARSQARTSIPAPVRGQVKIIPGRPVLSLTAGQTSGGDLTYPLDQSGRPWTADDPSRGLGEPTPAVVRNRWAARYPGGGNTA